MLTKNLVKIIKVSRHWRAYPVKSIFSVIKNRERKEGKIMNENWYRNSYRRCLVDIHIADWNDDFFSEIDPKNYAEMMALSGIDTAIIYSSSCLGICNWPTKHGHMHNQLKGRDLLKELISECRKKNLNIVVYFNIWSRWVYDTHPEWRIVLPNGKGTVEDGWRHGLCCPNTGYYDYVLKMIEELCSNYDSDGLWVDMIGWFSKICYCSACKQRFLEETGREIPREINWNNEDWLLFQRKREEWLANFAEAVSLTARKAKPGISITLQNTSMGHDWPGGVNLKFTQQSDYLAGDFTGGSIEQSYVCKLLNSLSKNNPIEFMTPRCECLRHHTTNKPHEKFLMQGYAAIANNACFVLIDAIDPVGTLNQEFYKQANTIFKEIKKYEQYLDGNSKLIADVAIYYSFESALDFSMNGTNTRDFIADIAHSLKNKNIVETFSKHHIPFTLITEKDLDNLSDYQVVILSDVMMMDEREVSAFENYVQDGGSIYASMRTSLFPKNGTSKNDFQLNDLFGVSYSGKDTCKINYMSPAKASVLSKHCSEKYPLMIEKEQMIVEPKDITEVLASITLPYTNPEDNNLFSSAISNPPGIYTKHPSLTRNKYGKGYVIYSAGDIESLPYDMHRDIYADIVKSLFSGRMFFETNAPKPVEIIVFKQAKNNRIIINMLNYQADLPPIPVYNLSINISTAGTTPLKMFSAPENTELKYKKLEGDRIEFEVDKLEMFRMFVLNYK
ncbi:MAG: alpha-L-fucosidase [Victivallaceae bacterium]|nr:alpha-L-fucosidase [Victivallaceae bacterium]MDD4180829.1 alpha-L-fucosidase [Victivallaceae bacterium]